MKKSELMKVLQGCLELQNAMRDWIDTEIESRFKGDKLDRAKCKFDSFFESYDENMWLPSLAHIDNEIGEEDKRSEKYRNERNAKAELEKACGNQGDG